MREAVIVSSARTPPAKAYRGEFDITPGPRWRPLPCVRLPAAGLFEID